MGKTEGKEVIFLSICLICFGFKFLNFLLGALKKRGEDRGRLGVEQNWGTYEKILKNH